MIVVEGPDGGGKTTLAKALSKKLGWPIAPRVVSQQAKALVDIKSWVEDNVSKGFHEVIYDRHRLISEPIYGPLLRDEVEPGFDDPHWLFDSYVLFNRCHPIVIYCIPPLNEVWKNIKEGEDDNSVVEHKVAQLYSMYATQAARDVAAYPGGDLERRPKYFIYDYTLSFQSLEDFVGYIAQKSLRLQHAAGRTW